MSIPMALSSEIFVDDILKKSLIFKEKRLDLVWGEGEGVSKERGEGAAGVYGVSE